ncbi:MAG: hypothetical protein EA357_03045 [Micavibrio sp.]|nr:MAG: hypothetical protein EA357_03045 [Micavibrio sp.]
MHRIFPFIKAFPLILAVFLLSGCAALTDWRSPQEEITEEPAQLIVEEPAPAVMGFLENIKLAGHPAPLEAKLDSGTAMTSLNAEIIRVFQRDKSEHVLFRVMFGEKEEIFEAPVKRWAQIRVAAEEEPVRRPVVEMSICLGTERFVGEVNLADRERSAQPVLIGRNMLDGRILVDTAQRFTHAPKCVNGNGQIPHS